MILGGLLLGLILGAGTSRASNQPPTTVHPLLQIAPVNTYVVTKTDDAGIQSKGAPGTLRWAMNQANASAGFDLIRFDLPGSGVQTITVKDWLPDLVDNAGVMIDGTQSNDRIQLDMGQANPYHDAIALSSNNNVIKGLVINNCPNGVIGISTRNGGSYNLIIGNYLGTNAAGTSAKKMMEGVHLHLGSHDNIVGGTNGVTPGGACTGDCNLISGNYQHGVVIDKSNNNKVIGNFIGLNVNGTDAIPNADDGLLIVNAANNTIGGPSPQERNVIAGNANINIEIGQTDIATRSNRVLGNYIGTNSAGSAGLAGQNNGVVLDENSSDTTLDGNVISGNAGTGVLIFTGSSRNKVTNNNIGVGANGVSRVANGGIGILIQTNNNQITDNIVAYHSSDGIRIKSGTGNQIRRNSTYANTKLAINVAVDGFTPNDNTDPDTGPNMLQNFPDLTGAGVNGGTMTIQGSLNSRPNQKYVVDFYQNPACDNTYNRHVGQGKNYLGSTEVNTGGNGNAAFTAAFATLLNSGFVIATATDASGNTSEFSVCVQIVSTLPVPPKPQLTSPGDGGTVSNNPPLLTWNPSANAVHYVVLIRQDAIKGVLVHKNANVVNNQYTPPALDAGHTYFWRVNACNSDGKCSKSAWFSFYVP